MSKFSVSRLPTLCSPYPGITSEIASEDQEVVSKPIFPRIWSNVFPWESPSRGPFAAN